jgi:hypothetical protein
MRIGISVPVCETSRPIRAKSSHPLEHLTCAATGRNRPETAIRVHRHERQLMGLKLVVHLQPLDRLRIARFGYV